MLKCKKENVNFTENDALQKLSLQLSAPTGCGLTAQQKAQGSNPF